MSIQDVDARLWQDPLEAIEVRHQELGTPYGRKTHHFELVREKLSRAVNPLILAVMVNGSGYAEKIERRLRDRVAVENALDRAGYSPEDAEHLGSFTIPWSRAPENLCEVKSWPKPSAAPSPVFRPSRARSAKQSPHAENKNNVQSALETNSDWSRDDWDTAWSDNQDTTWLTIPFEFHKPDAVDTRKPSNYDRMLVLWLRQEFFDDSPLSRLAELFSWFQQKDGNVCGALKILGPDTSDSLLRMVNEAQETQLAGQPNSDAKKQVWERVTQILNSASIFAFRPSAADQILLRNDSVKRGSVKSVIEESCKGLKFYRTTAGDDALLKELTDELLRRHINPYPDKQIEHECIPVFGCSDVSVSGRDAIAIISEQDTLFARALPATFNLLIHGSRQPPQNVELLSYVRGIDGRSPIRQSPSASVSSGTVPSPTPSSNQYNTTRRRGARELPEGTDQSDYIRRLAKRISSLDDLHRALDDQLRPRGITAVGVLGSDVYDKLEILHALHSRLRPKVFFTTGLDARFYHPDELSATRNLVVVSAFGLRLHLYYQGSVPPFRDHNQTAAFAAALCALDVIKDPSKVTESKPRIFEISTNGPVDLSVDEDKRSDLDELREVIISSEEPNNIHPGRPDLRNWWEKDNKIAWTGIAYRLTAFVVLIVALSFACYYIWCRQQQHPEVYQASVFAKSTVVAISLSLPLILIILALLYYLQRWEGEPFNLFASASMWATEGIRLIVIVLSIHFVVKSFALLKENSKNEIEPAFNLGDGPLPTPWWRKLRETLWVWKQSGKPDIQKLWKEYCQRDSPLCRLAWTGLWSIPLYGVIAFCLWKVSRQAIPPVRGSLILKLDPLINFIAMAASTFLTLFVAYVTGLNARFVILLSKGETGWPEPVRKWHQFHLAEGAEWTDWNGDYLDVLLIARRTRAVTRLIYYPFVTISLLILCRLPQFDNFDWPPLLIAFFSFNIIVPCACVAVLRRVAEMVRRDSLVRLRKKLREARAVGPDVKREAIETTVAEIKKLDTGIFAPITRQPVVGALLLPFGSVGISALLQYFH